MTHNDLLLPEGARLLHIGPPKTGTTAIQSALKRSQRALARHGVVYPGKERQHWRAAQVAIGARGRRGVPPVDPRSWKRLVRQVTRAGEKRVVVSAEMFANADEAAARRVVADLGGSSVHVVVTLRPLARILPSNWQQTMHQGSHSSYEEWLVGLLGEPPYEGPPSYGHQFWRRHRHDLLVRLWAAAVGVSNLTVVVVDESDRRMLMRTFEHLLGLPDGLLQPPTATNPSLAYGEVEMVRHVNREFRLRGWSDEQHRVLVHKGLAHHLQHAERPRLDNQRISTPGWAADRIAEVGAAAAEGIAGSGVRVVGDLSVLGARPETYEPDDAPEPVVPAESATLAVVGVMLAAERDRRMTGGRT